MIRYSLALIFIIAAGALFFSVTKPLYDSTLTTQTQIDTYNSALDKAAEIQQLKQSLLTTYNAFKPTDISRLETLLPDHVDNVKLILDLDNLASRFGMAMQNVDVSQPASTATNAQGVITAGASSAQKYDSVTIHFSMHGTYAMFTQFLSSLESSLRIVDIQSLSVSADGSSAVANQEPFYKFDVALRTYWLR